MQPRWSKRQTSRAPLARGERELVADALRRFAASAMEPMPHGLDTLVKGQLRDSVPEFIVAVEAFGPPTCLGFGRIAVVKPCPGAREVAVQLKRCDSPLDTLGICAGLSERDRSALRLAGAKRICELGARRNARIARSSQSSAPDRSKMLALQ